MQILDWQQLDAAGRARRAGAPGRGAAAAHAAQAQAIIDAVRARATPRTRRCARIRRRRAGRRAAVSAAEFAAARAQLAPEQLAALEKAIANVDSFHRAGLPSALSLEVQPGVRCERLIRPIGAVGCMCRPAPRRCPPPSSCWRCRPASPAAPQRVLCTPPQRSGLAHAAVLVAAQLCGIEQVFKIGGAQAIAAMAYGSAGVPKVAKIFGPGNAWVTAAKQLVAADPAGAALDLPAGPSEVLVIADDSARAEFVAADLLAQAEHDPHCRRRC
jgi:histidinol dehydrogenase